MRSLEHVAHTGNRAAGSDHRDEDVDLAVGIAPDFFSRRAAMNLGIRRIFELLRHEILGRRGARISCALRNRTFHAVGARRQHDLRTVRFEQIAALDRHRVRHDENQRIAFGGGDERERDAGVAARRFENGHSGTQATVAFGGFDHRNADAILHRTGRIERLHLHENRAG